MLVAAMMADVGPPSAVYVGQAHTAGPADSDPDYPYLYPDMVGAGAQVGDYVLIFIQRPDAANGYPSMSGPGWNQDNYTWTPGSSFKTSVIHKLITSAGDLARRLDIQSSSPTGSTNTSITTLVYRGATSAARVSLNWDGDGGATHSSAGYAKSYGCVGTVGILAHWDVNSATPAEAITGGAIVQRLNWTNYMRIIVADALGRYDYPSGATVDWSGLSTTLSRALVSMLYELRA